MDRMEMGIVRPNWQELIRQQGLTFSETPLPGGGFYDYWTEGPYLMFTEPETKQVFAAGGHISQMYYDLAEYLVQHPNDMRRMGIGDEEIPLICRSWEEDAPSVYGRLDLRYAGPGAPSEQDPTLLLPKVLEYNADTPTSLIEAAVTQFWWQVQSGQGRDIWSRMDDLLAGYTDADGNKVPGAWERQMQWVEETKGREVRKIFFAYTADEDSGEDRMNTAYLADTAMRAGFEVELVFIEDVRLQPESGGFYYARGGEKSAEHIDVIFKLYPWEWMLDDKFGADVLKDMAAGEFQADGQRRGVGSTIWIEPLYKRLWSNKASLPFLWRLFRDHEVYGQYLLPAYFPEDPEASKLTSFVRKPWLGREGAVCESLMSSSHAS